MQKIFEIRNTYLQYNNYQKQNACTDCGALLLIFASVHCREVSDWVC